MPQPRKGEMSESILVIDDNVEFLRVVSVILSDGSPAFTVHTATGGLEGLEQLAAAASPPSVVVLDFHLPDIDAPEVLRRLRSSPRGSDLPVLVLTQADWHRDAEMALAAGATAIFVKPSRVTKLRDLIVAFWREHCAGAG